MTRAPHRRIAVIGRSLVIARCSIALHVRVCSSAAQRLRQRRAQPTAALEEIYILRSIREQHEPVAGWCSSARTGFEPFPTDAERFFSFWSVRLRPEDGRVVEAKDTRVAELRGCFGATSERARQNFYAEIKLGSISFRGNGECLALKIDFPEAGLFPVRCQLVLSGLPAPYVGGLLDDEHDDEQGRLWRRHRSARIHPGLDRHDSPLEGQVRPRYAIEQPADIDINEIVLRPTAEESARAVLKHENRTSAAALAVRTLGSAEFYCRQ